MAIEKSWSAVPPRAFTADGGQFGLVTITDTSGFKVKMKVSLQSIAVNPTELQIKRVLSSTQMLIGPVGAPLNGTKSQSDLSAFLLADNASIFAGEQPKSVLKPDDILQAIYDQEPSVAIRVINVDQFGNFAGSSGGGSGGGLAPSGFDDVKIIKNSNGDPTQYQFFLNNASVGVINVTYDSFGASEYKKA